MFLYYFVCLCKSFKETLFICSHSKFLRESGCKGTTFFRNTKLFNEKNYEIDANQYFLTLQQTRTAKLHINILRIRTRTHTHTREKLIYNLAHQQIPVLVFYKNKNKQFGRLVVWSFSRLVRLGLFLFIAMWLMQTPCGVMM